MKAVVRPRLVVGTLVFTLLVVKAVQYVKWAGTGPGNFVAFYVAGRLAAEGRGNQLYDIAAEVRTLEGLGFGRGDYYLWVHPPFEALALEWVQPFSYRAAARIWAVLMLLAVAVAAWLLRDTGSIGIIVMGILLWGRRGVVDQDIALLLLVLVGSFLAFRCGLDGAGGGLLACGLFRFHLIWLLPAVLLLKRRWKALGSFCAVGTGLGAVSLAMVGPTMLQGYWATLCVTAGNDNYVLRMMPTARGFGWLLMPHSLWIVPALSCLVAGPVLIAWMWQAWDAGEGWEIMFAVTVVAGLATAYHSFLYDIVVLLLPVSVLGKRVNSRAACELLALIPLIPTLSCEAAVFPTLAGEVALMLLLWRRSRVSPMTLVPALK